MQDWLIINYCAHVSAHCWFFGLSMDLLKKRGNRISAKSPFRKLTLLTYWWRIIGRFRSTHAPRCQPPHANEKHVIETVV